MNTIAEKLQVIADSTSAIKQAIIDKGGEVLGGISTYANSIDKLNIQDTEFIFNVTISHGNQGNLNLTGNIDFGGKYPGPGAFYLAIDSDSVRTCYFTTMDKLVEFKGVYITNLDGGSNVDYAVFVPLSTSVSPTIDDPDFIDGWGLNIDQNKKIYMVKVNILNPIP